MRFTVFNTRVFISYYFVVLLGIITVCDKTALFLPVMSAAAIHETGHICAIKFCGYTLLGIDIYPFLIKARYNSEFTFLKMIAVYLCGPLCNILSGIILLAVYYAVNKQTVLIFSLVSFLVGAYNLMPCAGLDGGSILKLVLQRLFCQKTVKVLLIIISCVFTVAIIWFLLFTQNFKPNAAVLCLALYLFISTFVTEVKNIG